VGLFWTWVIEGLTRHRLGSFGIFHADGAPRTAPTETADPAADREIA
jgi:hypothetical protein